MRNLFWSVSILMLLLSGCGWNGTPTRHIDFVPLTSIEITAVSSTIAANTTTKLTVTGNYSGLFRDITDQATWSSDAPAVAGFITALEPNRVTGHTPGSAILTATVGGKSATFNLTVSGVSITSMTITPATPSVAGGLTTQFAVIGTFSDSTTQNLTFDSTWSSSAPTVATINDTAGSKGFCQALTAGTTTISATFGGISGTTLLTVTPAILQSIAVAPANSSISGFSKTVNFTATGTYSDGKTVDITSSAAWSSSATGVATIVAGSGVATTVAAGTTTISAALNGITGKTDLTVTAPVLATNGLKLTPESPVLSLSSGATEQLTVTATFIDNSTQNLTSSCSWSTNPTLIATVSSTGLLTGRSIGQASITATCLGQSVVTVVTVNP
jgi:hypothetical protein